MPDLSETRLLEAHRRWLGYVQPTGLVVSPVVLVQHTIGADSNVGPEQVRLGELVAPDTRRVTDIPAFLHAMLGWQQGDIATAPGELAVPLPELGTTLRPTYVVRDPAPADGAPPWQMLIGVEPDGRDLDAVEEGSRAWAATPHARFDRLLRATEIPIGLLTNGAEFRLVYAPRREASGYATFRIAELLKTDGRPILSGFLTLLQEQRLFGHPDDRLPRLLEDSRRYQTTVSAALAEQVLEGLYELLRGLHAADLRGNITRLRDQVRRDHDHVYAGLLTVMMRLVFVLYAEDRGLFPDDSVWIQNYALAGLYARLRDDAALHPDTMDDRYGAWAQLLALFRIVHQGAAHGSRLKLVARRGRLFDPDRFPFLEGRDSTADPPAPPRVPDGTIWRILQRLMLLHGERVSYGALDVEQIGSVYETMMGFTVQLTRGASLAVRAAKRGGAASVIDLDTLLAAVPAKRGEELAKQADRKFGNTVLAAVRAADTVANLERALQSVQDKAATPRLVPAGTPVLQPTPARRRTGSHYTPRSLTAPIVATALKPVLARLGDNPTPEAILELKVLDPAMGSGAFLVEACRQLADALVAAWSRHAAMPEIPPDEDPLIYAGRLVAQRCLYGVDHNPMAVDIAHLSLWLATLAKEHEFTFLEHALKPGDSLVGLTARQIGGMRWRDGQTDVAPFDGFLRERTLQALRKRAEIRAAPDDMTREIQEQRHRAVEGLLDQARRIGDAVLHVFFSEDNARDRERVRTELGVLTARQPDEYWPRIDQRAAALRHGEGAVLPFHWELEFPEVFASDNPGFDAIVGNPPFAGKNTIAESTRAGYPDWLKTLHEGAHGNADLVAHFFRRAFGLLRDGGCFGLIATNTIRQGDTRESGLRPILASGGTIIAAQRRLTWPGAAHVVVSVVHMLKGAWTDMPVLDGKPLSRISAFLVNGEIDATPPPLRANIGVAFQGSILLGMGFTFDDETNEPAANRLADMQQLIAKDPRNAERIRPYIGGDEVNDSPTHSHRRYAIDFADLPLRRQDVGFTWADADLQQRTTCLRQGLVPTDYPDPVAADWPDLLAIVEERVRPARLAQNREVRARFWWKFAERAPALYHAISELQQVMVAVQTSKHLCVAILPSALVYDQKLIVFALQGYAAFAVIQCRPHEVWARFFGSTMEDRPVYTPDDCLANFPFPPSYEE